MKSKIALLLMLAVLPASSAFIPVDFSAFHNRRLQLYSNDFPTGDVILDQVRFDIPDAERNVWHSALLLDGTNAPANSPQNPNPRTIIVPINIVGAFRLHTLINTVWGENTDGAFASIRLNFANNNPLIWNLDGNDEIRDYFNGSFTNTINNAAHLQDDPGTGQTTRNWVSGTHASNGGSVRLDHQEFDLPSAFMNDTLLSIEISDTGDANFQRIFVSGITVEAVPEPGTFALLGGALVGVGLLARRRRP